MTRPLHIWLLFTGCFAVLLAAMGWVSGTVLRLDRVQLQADHQAELEEKVRLALWRMDSQLAPLMVEESARPFQAYESFYAPVGAYTKGYAPVKQGDVLQPSPLLGLASSNLLLHFQLSADGRLTSPQVPPGAQRKLAESNYATREQIDVATERLGRLQGLLNEQCFPGPADASSIASTLARTATTTGHTLNRDLLINTCAMVGARTNTVGPVTVSAFFADNNEWSRQSPQGQQARNSAEWQARASVYQNAQQQAALNSKLQQQIEAAPPRAPVDTSLFPNAGLLKPLWLGQDVVLARRAEFGGRFVVQGCWLNWPALRQSLVDGVKDLFPDAELQPMLEAVGERNARMLAALPVKLITGPVPAPVLPSWSPIRISLLVAWGCVLLAAAAVAVLLHGTLTLSERRAAFVSAVTHELRTPLTTFKMYSEMLAEGMVPEEARRKHYLSTLCSEANRLSHLVENVLAYARLERGSARSRVERVSLGALLNQVKPRLDQRATQAGMTVVVDAEEGALKTEVQIDVAAVEQILFNLVDNACKYAAPTATEKFIHLEALPEGQFAMLRVRDHGRGISAEGARRLFQPFSKSAHEAAHSAPGVGLGLALCRRLSRSMGGDLRFERMGSVGACFVLTLPLLAPDGAAASLT